MTRIDRSPNDVAVRLDPRPDSQAERIRELEAADRCHAETIAQLRGQIAERDLAYKNLAGAIASSRRIGAAIGIVMSAMRTTEDDAFAVLTAISQRQNRKVRLVADDIVLTGTF